MRIGVPREIKNHEYRVGLTPESTAELVAAGHEVMIETMAGDGIGKSDDHYAAVGAKILPDAPAVFGEAEMVVKVKEPQPVERTMLRKDQILFTYLHLAPDPEQTVDLMKSGAVCIAYETVTDASGGLPLLKPMSQVAGRMSIQAGASALEKAHGGRGVLLGGVPGVQPGKVVIIGGGVVGFNAAQMAVGIHANVSILDKNPAVLERLENHFEASAKVLFSTQAILEDQIARADLVVGAVLVDVAIDQGGCFETSQPTTHADPTYVVDGIVHYCVANMPGGVAHTSTYALNNVTLPHTLRIANLGWKQALESDPHLLNGLNVCGGQVTCRPVAEAQGLDYVPAHSCLT